MAAGLFLASYGRILHRSFEERSLAYVQAFAAAAQPWADRAEIEMLRSAAQLLLAGSAIYVQIAGQEGLLVDERSAAGQGVELDQEPRALVNSVERVARTSGGSHLDIAAPLPAGAGYVRVGIDRSSVAAQAAGATGLAVGAALGFDLLVVLILFVSQRRRFEGAGAPPTSPNEPASRLLVTGRLRIDSSEKSVRLGEDPVRLTPKQFALLELLAGSPGRVFSEAEILEAAWPDSPYADSKDIKQYVYLVRKRLAEVDETARELIETVPGFGYRLATEGVDREMTES